MFIRFVINTQLPDMAARRGIFGTAYSLLKNATADRTILQQIQAELAWFEEHLTVPDRFNKTKSKGAYRRNTKGIAWFRNNGSEALERTYALSELIKCCCIDVHTINSDRIGYVVYEDDVQVLQNLSLIRRPSSPLNQTFPTSNGATSGFNRTIARFKAPATVTHTR